MALEDLNVQNKMHRIYQGITTMQCQGSGLSAVQLINVKIKIYRPKCMTVVQDRDAQTQIVKCWVLRFS